MTYLTPSITIKVYTFAKWGSIAMVVLIAGFYIPTTEQGWADESPRPYLMLIVIGGMIYQFLLLRTLIKEEKLKV